MSISKKKLTVVIVTFKSDHVIHDCIKSIPNQINIIIVDNSNDKKFKNDIEKSYRNVKCILSSKNLGMGSGNNLALKHVKTDFAIILNPDVILENDTIEKIIDTSKEIDSFAILAPISSDKSIPNYKIFNKSNEYNKKKYFEVDTVDGFAMILNLKKINQFRDFKNFIYFDENFFMYLENDDFCKRIKDLGENIYVIRNAKIKHLGAKAVNQKYSYEIELSRNWHWMWSKFYFNKKYYGFFFAILNGLPSFLSSSIKFLIYIILNKKNKKEVYFQRISGFLNALIGNNSFYRPRLKK